MNTKLCKVASRWKYIKRNILTMHEPLNVKFMNDEFCVIFLHTVHTRMMMFTLF